MGLSAWVALACYLTASARGAQYLNGSYGNFQSSNYPDEYDDSSSEDWIINVTSGYRIKLRFISFDLEDSYDEIRGPCVKDLVTVTEPRGVLGKYCGNPNLLGSNAPNINKLVYSKNNTMRIHFESDSSNDNIKPTGFLAEYAEDDIDECAIQRHKQYTATEDWYELLTCNHYCINTLGSYRCACRRGFELHENGHTCFAKFCENQVLTDLQGDISSPDYPASYAKLSKCVWDIKLPAGSSIQLSFNQSFDIEEHVDNGCVYDILTISYKTSSDSFCGRVPPQNGGIWNLNTNEARIEFTTDFSVEKMGFKLHYNTTKMACLKYPLAPTNGRMVPNSDDSYQIGDSIQFFCNRGYDLIGASVINCLSNGEWDFKEPICEIKSCGRPDFLIAVKHSSIENFENKTFTYLEKVTVVCDEWYECKGYSTWRCEDSKVWTEDSGSIFAGDSNNIPICRPICGKRLVADGRASVQISGGKVVRRDGGWPWMAFIDLGGGRNGTNYCGGTLIDDETVVTSAVCIEEIDEHSDVEVWLGLRNRRTDNYNFTQKFVVPSNRRYVYEGYNFLNAGGLYTYPDGDIAILKLGRPADLSFYVRPICVPFGSKAESLISAYQQSKSRKNAIVTGWGATPGDEHSDVLMKARLGIVDSRTCQENYRDQFGGAITITANMICAGYEYGPSRRPISDTCRSDTGGPLMTKWGMGRGETWYLSGIASFGDARNGCGGGRTYGVYTYVSKFQDFILTHT